MQMDKIQLHLIHNGKNIRAPVFVTFRLHTLLQIAEAVLKSPLTWKRCDTDQQCIWAPAAERVARNVGETYGKTRVSIACMFASGAAVKMVWAGLYRPKTCRM